MSIDYRSLAKSLIREFTGDSNILSIPRKFIDLTGDLNSAALLNQILYWSSRTKDPDGWFYKTYPEWKEEIGLSQYQVKRAITGDKRSKDRLTLEDLGVQTIRKKQGKGAVKLHYRIDMDVFFTQFDNFLNMNNVDNRQCSQSKNMNNVDNPYTETTSETTKRLYVAPDGTTDDPFSMQQELIPPPEDDPDDSHLMTCDNCGKQQAVPHLTSVGDVYRQYGWTLKDRVLFCNDCTLAETSFEPTPLYDTPAMPGHLTPKAWNDAWYDAVKDTMGVEGFKNGNIVNTLRRKGKNGYTKYDLETPLTDPEQVHIFWAWYQSICAGCSLVSPATVQDYVMRWQSAGMPDVRNGKKSLDQMTEREKADYYLELGRPYNA